MPGYNLIYSEVDPDDNRLRRIYLTQNGHEVWAEILEAMGADEETTQKIAQSGRKAISREAVPPVSFSATRKVYEKGQAQEEESR